MHELPWIAFFVTSDLPMIFTNDEVTSENRWQIASRGTQKLSSMVTNILFYFFKKHAIWCAEHTIPLKQLSIADFAIVFSDLVLWRHHKLICGVTRM